MGDLEESILKQNVPGRYSKWNAYNSDGIRKSYIGDDEDDDNDHNNNGEDFVHDFNSSSLPQSPLTHDFNYSTNDSQRKHRTGVKGVLSDYKEAKQMEKVKFQNEQLKRKEAFQRAAEGSWMKPGEKSISIASIEQQNRIEKQNQKGRRESDGSGSSSEDDDSFFDDENDTFLLESYRRMRLSQMQQSALPEYGQVYQLHTPYEFSDMIDQTDQRVYCIIHLYDDGIGSCRLLNQYFDQLASNTMINSRFLKIEALALKNDFDFIGLPCVLIYKAGEEVANLTPITEMFDSSKSRSGAFTIEEVEYVLKQSCGINTR